MLTGKVTYRAIYLNLVCESLHQIKVKIFYNGFFTVYFSAYDVNMSYCSHRSTEPILGKRNELLFIITLKCIREYISEKETNKIIIRLLREFITSY